MKIYKYDCYTETLQKFLLPPNPEKKLTIITTLEYVWEMYSKGNHCYVRYENMD